MREVRKYQVDFVNNFIRALFKDKHVIGQSPTGSGKSYMMSQVIERGTSKGYTFLVLTESKKIFTQLSNEFNAIRINAKTNYFVVRRGAVYVAMSQSLSNRKSIIQQFLNLGDNLILLTDEAHIGTTRKVIELFPGMRGGFTATPAWRWAKFLPDLYKSIVLGPQVEELIQNGSLAPYRPIGREKIEQSDLKTDSKGEYTEKSQEYAFGKTEIYDGLYEDLKNISYTKCIIYVASIKQCDDVYDNLLLHGYKCAVFHSKNEESEQHITNFHGEEVDIMVSVAALTKGYDNPKIDLVVLFRATTSLPLYLQMCGRGGRPLPGKKNFIVLDYGLNYKRFGSWDADRDWEKLWLPQPKKAELPAPVKLCPSCDSYLHTSAMFCKWCEYEFPKIETQYQQGELVDQREPYTELIGMRLSDLNPQQLAIYAKTKNKSQYAIRIAKSQRLQQKIERPDEENWLKQFGSAMGYKPNWYMVNTRDIDSAIRSGTKIDFYDSILK